MRSTRLAVVYQVHLGEQPLDRTLARTRSHALGADQSTLGQPLSLGSS